MGTRMRMPSWPAIVMVAAAGVLMPGASPAQDFPSRPIRLVVISQAGTGGDVTARRITPKLAAILGQSVVVDNRPGAGGNIGADLVAKARPDGYTLVLGTTATHAANPYLYRSMPYDAAGDFTPVVAVLSYGMILAVNASSPLRSLPELIAQAKQKPKGYEAALPNTTARLVLELLRSAAGVELLPVPYAGAPSAVADTVAGRVAMVIDTSSALLGQIRSGALRPLAMSTERRLEAFPDVPTFRELGADVVASPLNAIFGPRGLPPAVVQTINTAVNKAFADRELREALIRDGAQPLGGTADELDRTMRIERGKWEAVVRATGMRAD